MTEVNADPVARKYLRKFVGARELLHDVDRWCLWLEELEAVREFRLSSKKKATCDLAATPHLFAERRQPTMPYLCIPSVVSETRKFFTTRRLPVDTISSNLVFTAEDADGYLFGIVSSSMFITWQKAIGGRLESRLRFSNTVVWNNLPLPVVNDQVRKDIIAAGDGVVDARNLHPERSLAEHYNPLTMAPELLKAHKALDQVVDRAFGAKTRLDTDEERLTLLFKNYLKLTEAEAL